MVTAAWDTSNLTALYKDGVQCETCCCVGELGTGCTRCFAGATRPSLLRATFTDIRACDDDQIITALNSYEFCMSLRADCVWRSEAIVIDGDTYIAGYVASAQPFGAPWLSKLSLTTAVIGGTVYFLSYWVEPECTLAFANDLVIGDCGNTVDAPLRTVVGYDGTGLVVNPLP